MSILFFHHHPVVYRQTIWGSNEMPDIYFILLGAPFGLGVDEAHVPHLFHMIPLRSSEYKHYFIVCMIFIKKP